VFDHLPDRCGVWVVWWHRGHDTPIRCPAVLVEIELDHGRAHSGGAPCLHEDGSGIGVEADFAQTLDVDGRVLDLARVLFLRSYGVAVREDISVENAFPRQCLCVMLACGIRRRVALVLFGG
jgi:hypothetical protein